MIDTNKQACNLSGRQSDCGDINEIDLLDELTSRLIKAIELVEAHEAASQASKFSPDLNGERVGKEQIRIVFSEIRDLIVNNELQPRFLAALDRHYQTITGRGLKAALGAYGSELELSFQLAIDVATKRAAAPTSPSSSTSSI